MSQSVSWLDRLRIERVVWLLDQRLYDLPRRSRVAIRREVRNNITSAAGDVGAGVALQRLGRPADLAAGYLTAEYGDGPRHSWTAAAIFFAGFPLVLIAMLGEAANAFAEGIRAADAHATGTYAWNGIGYLQTEVTYTFTNGHWTSTGGAMAPLAWALLVVGTVLAGRMWRLVPTRRRRREARSAG